MTSLEEENYLRLNLLVDGICPRAVRSYFDTLFSPQSLYSTLSDVKNKSTLTNLHNRRTITRKQWDILYPHSGIPKSDNFDTTLMICLIRNLSTLSPPVNGYDEHPVATENTPSADLARIKYHRNFLAHLGKTAVETHVFNLAWSCVSSAVVRLGGSPYQYECDCLQKRKFDVGIDNIIESTASILARRRKEIFIRPSMAAETAVDLLRSCNVVLLTGKEGCGKSTLAYHLMEEKNQKYFSTGDAILTPVLVYDTNDLKSVIRTDGKFIIFIDDPFGKSNFVPSKFEDWDPYMINLKSTVKDGSYLIIALRNSVMKECVFHLQRLQIFKANNIVDLSTEVMRLNVFEKREMIMEYCKAYNVNITFGNDSEMEVVNTNLEIGQDVVREIVAIDPMIGFPQSCFLFFTNTDIFWTGVAFFKNARIGLVQEISSLYSNTDQSKKVYAVLVLAMILGGEIDLALQNDDIKAKVFSSLDVEVRRIEMKSILDRELCFFEKKSLSDDIYQFNHQTILESILQSYAQESDWGDIIFEYATDAVIVEFARPFSYRAKKDEVCFTVKQDHTVLLVDKLISIYSKNENKSEMEIQLQIPPEIIIAKHPSCDTLFVVDYLDNVFFKKKTSQNYKHYKLLFTYACQYARYSLICLLLKMSNVKHKIFKDEDLNIAFKNGVESLLYECDRSDILQDILETNTSFLKVAKNVVYEHPLPVAIMCGRRKCTELLLRYCADLKFVIKYGGDSVLHLCVNYPLFWPDIMRNIIDTEPELLLKLNDRGQSVLIAAASNSNVKSLEFLLAYGNDLLIKDKYERNVLHVLCESVEYDCTNIIDKLIEKDRTLINAQCKFSKTALMLCKNKQNARALLHWNPDLSLIDDSCNTVLHHFAKNDWCDLIDEVLEKDQKLLNKQNDLGETVLMTALYNRAVKSSSLLLESGIDFNLTNTNNENVLHYCARSNLDNLCTEIKNRQDDMLDQRNVDGMSPLMVAASHGSGACGLRLFELGANISLQDNKKNNILHVCSDGSEQLVSIILQRNQKLLYEINESEETPCMKMVLNNAPKCLESVFMQQNDLVFHARGEKTLLHFAIIRTVYLPVCKILVETNKAILNEKDPNRSNMIPLFIAANHNRRDIYNYLCQNFSDFDMMDSHGNTILHYVMENRWIENAKDIVRLKANMVNTRNNFNQSPLMYAFRSSYEVYTDEHINLLKFVLDQDCDLTIKDVFGQNILHYVCKNEVLSELILENNFSLLNSQSNYGFTAIMTFLVDPICFNGDNLLKYFVNKGADLTLEAENGNNILHFLAYLNNLPLYFNTKDSLSETAKSVVISCKSMLNKPNKNGRTPIMQAAIASKLQYFKFLLHNGASVVYIDRYGKTVLDYCLENYSGKKFCPPLAVSDPSVLSINRDLLTLLVAKVYSKYCFMFLRILHGRLL